MQVTNKDGSRRFLPRGAGEVFTDASLADRTYFVFDDKTDGELLLRLWLPGRIVVNDDPAVPWNICLKADVDERQNFVVTSLLIERREGGPGITAAGLRKVLVGELIDELLSRPPIAQMVRRTDELHHFWPAVNVPVPLGLLAEARRRTQTQRGRSADPDEVRARLEQVAAVARSAQPGRLLKDLADALNISKASAKKLLREAREAGVLEHSTRSARGQR
jgi:hypothetical protein